VTAPDETDSLHCPRDGAALDARTYEEHIEVDSCPTCRGMWLDSGELEAIQRSAKNDYTRELDRLEAEDASHARVASQIAHGPIACPVCTKEMEIREYGYGAQVVIDTCVEGCGVWLDAGEIQALERFFERAQKASADVIPLRWRLWASVQSVLRRSPAKKR
jgi:Zn-finger nucleic acid-binding protein